MLVNEVPLSENEVLNKIRNDISLIGTQRDLLKKAVTEALVLLRIVETETLPIRDDNISFLDRTLKAKSILEMGFMEYQFEKLNNRI